MLLSMWCVQEMRTVSQFEALQAEHLAVVSQLRDKVADLGDPHGGWRSAHV